MATLTELVISRTLSKTSGTLNFYITETNSEVTALNALISGTATSFNGLSRSDYAVEPIGDPTETESWIGVVSYGTTSRSSSTGEVGSSSYSFDTSGGSQHITQSLSTVDSQAVSGTAPDYKGAINVSLNGNNRIVNGVDISVPIYSFSETHILAAATVTTGYKSTLFATTGKVNNATFKGTNAGECLFLGATGSMRNEDEWEITYKFAASPNKTGISIGSMSIDKKGWEYLWVAYGEKLDSGSDQIVKVPTSCYVEEVYKDADFSALGIGTS